MVVERVTSGFRWPEHQRHKVMLMARQRRGAGCGNDLQAVTDSHFLHSYSGQLHHTCLTLSGSTRLRERVSHTIIGVVVTVVVVFDEIRVPLLGFEPGRASRGGCGSLIQKLFVETHDLDKLVHVIVRQCVQWVLSWLFEQ